MLYVDPDSTNDLVDKLELDNLKVDDLTEYSDNDPIFNSTPSIEIGRSANNKKLDTTDSPLRKYRGRGSLGSSPSRRIRNDYSEHLHRIRGSNKSPLKKKTRALQDDSIFLEDPFNVSLSLDGYGSTNDDVDEEIQKILDSTSVKKATNDVEEQDKSELLIRETHKLVNSLPISTTSNKEGEIYQSLLTSSINKLIEQYEKTKSLSKLKTKEARNLKEQVKNLESNVEILRQENMDYKREISRLRSGTNEDSKKEKELLRTKLIKYKNLVTESDQKNQELKLRIEELEKGKENPKNEHCSDRIVEQPSEDNYIGPEAKYSEEWNKKFLQLYNQFMDILNRSNKNESRKKEPISLQLNQYQETTANQKEKPNMKVWGILDDLVKAVIEEKSETQPDNSASEIPEDKSSEKKDLLNDILYAVEKNNSLYSNLARIIHQSQTPPQTDTKGGEPKPPTRASNVLSSSSSSDAENSYERNSVTTDNAPSTTKEAKAKSLILKCYLTCPHLNPHNKKRPCAKCSTFESQVNEGSEDNKTMNLMGEYQWSI